MGRRHEGKTLAVIGASAFQDPLITKAQELGCYVHAFAWECGDPGESSADVFHPVSTAEREQILHICRRLGIDGVCTIGSDFNNITATWIANQLGLPANSNDCVRLTTDKHAMREALAAGGDPSPKSVSIREGHPLPESLLDLRYPVIVKPSDRSGSRGITKLENPDGLQDALADAWGESFSKVALVEEFLEGDEFSVECLSWQGEHHVLQITRKFTSGAPHFIETAHIQPPLLPPDAERRIVRVVTHALSTLRVTQGASHAEVKVNDAGEPWIVEIGSRMGGDFIGSDLVPLSTGIDFVACVVDAALGFPPHVEAPAPMRAAAVRFVLSQQDADVLDSLRHDCPDLIVRGEWSVPKDYVVTDSSNRFGYCIVSSDSTEEISRWLPMS